MTTLFDSKIINGTIIDGTGKKSFRGNIGIKAGKIVEIGECVGESTQTIDAEGAIVTPGFVDIHTHYDGQISWDSDLAPSSLHGVTTCVMGNCGVGFAPAKLTDHQKLIELMEGVEDIPGTALTEGLTWNWKSFPEYMQAIDSLPHTIDFCAQLAHDPLRVFVMGERAIAEETATPEDIEAMCELTREALQHGAVGFSTGRSDVHKTAKGAPTPSSEAHKDELAGIAKAFQDFDHGVIQIVSDFNLYDTNDDFDKEFDLVDAMAEASKHPVSMSVMQRDQSPNQWKWIIKRTEEAVERGLNMRMQVAPRPIGVLLGLNATFHPFIGYPSYKKISELSLSQRVAAMREPEFKQRLLQETSEKVSGDGSSIPPLVDILLAQIDKVAMRIYRLGEVPNYEPTMDSCLYKEAVNRGCSSLEVIYDALLEDDGHALLYFPIYNYTNFSLDNVSTMLTHPLSLPGLSDGGAHVGTVCDASFPTYLLTHWGRDRKKDSIPIEKIIKMQCHDTAEFIGLKDRGTLEVGKKADINVIDFSQLQVTKPVLINDLPAGGKRLMQGAKGYRCTMVSGQVILENDTLTGAYPGRLVRVGV